MSTLLPDCGILSSPSASKTEFVRQPPVASPSAMFGAGSSVSFYSSPKSSKLVAPSFPPRPANLPSKARRRAAGGINKGVGHGIKKPSLKAKNKAKKQAKVAVRRLKQVKPPPRLAEHRCPAVRPSSQIKKRQLSSPGKTLLDSPECEDFLPPKYGDEKKIFTSRARTAATVQITKNVTLSAKYGEISLQQRGNAIGLRRNIGKNTTEKPEMAPSAPLAPVNVVAAVNAAQSNKPKPTRFLESSPVSKCAEINKENAQSVAAVRSSPRRPLAAARCLYQASSPRRSPPPDVIPVRSSPRRQSCVPSPTKSHNTPTKSNRNLSLRTSVLRQLTPTKSLQPTRSSPRKWSNNSSPMQNSPSRASQQFPLPRQIAARESEVNSPKRNVSMTSPFKSSAQSSPRRVMTRDSPLRTKQINSTPSVEEARPNDEVEHNNLTSPSHDSSVSQKNDALKYFPIFDPERRRSHTPAEQHQSKSRKVGITAARGDSRQMILDAGQKEFGATQCKECGLVYEYADPDDEALHRSFHNRVLSALSYSAWKKEHQISAMDSHGGRCILVSPGDPHYCWRKVKDVLAVVDEELGFENKSSTEVRGVKAVLYVTEGKVVGLLIAEPISEAYRVVPNTAGASGGETLLCCSEVSCPVKYGISRLWVHKDKRRSRLATKLVDAFRGHMIMYHYLKMDEFAFSDPTPSGLRFARSYTGKEDFLVYRHSV